jgi:hypothetical protein
MAGLSGSNFSQPLIARDGRFSRLPKGDIHLGDEIQMWKLLSVIVAVGLAVAFAGPGFAASKVL